MRVNALPGSKPVIVVRGEVVGTWQLDRLIGKRGVSIVPAFFKRCRRRIATRSTPRPPGMGNFWE